MLNLILNLTKYPATQEQLAAGVVDLPPASKQKLEQLLTFDTPPSPQELSERATDVALFAATISNARQAMINGEPFFIKPLEEALKLQGIDPLFSFVTRDNPPKHMGFVNSGKKLR